MKSAKDAISLCMIVKDEAEYIDGCLQTVSPWVQEIILIDTGSVDDTRAVAARYNAKIHSFLWKDNFAAARNFSLEQAIHPWILIMDADEKLSASDAEALPALVANSSPMAYSLTQRNYLFSSGIITWDQSWQSSPKDCNEAAGYPGYLDVPVVRLFPRNPQIRFRGCVHESVEHDIVDLGLPLERSGLVLHHYGQVRAKDRMKAKKHLYVELGRKKLVAQPTSARAHFEMGIQLQELDQLAEAAVHFSRASDLDPDFALARFYLGICYSRLQKYPEAKSCLAQARQALPNSPELENELGVLALKTGDYQSAERHFHEALVHQPHHVASLCYLGALKVGAGKVDTGIELLKKALEVDPRHRDTLVNLARASQQLGRYEQACQYLDQAGALTSQDPALVRMLGTCLFMAGQNQKANEVLRNAVHQWPEDKVLRSYWAASLASSGEKALAIDLYQTLLQEEGGLKKLALQQIEKLDAALLTKH